MIGEHGWAEEARGMGNETGFLPQRHKGTMLRINRRDAETQGWGNSQEAEEGIGFFNYQVLPFMRGR